MILDERTQSPQVIGRDMGRGLGLDGNLHQPKDEIHFRPPATLQYATS
jgi:hypothetical protein